MSESTALGILRVRSWSADTRACLVTPWGRSRSDRPVSSTGLSERLRPHGVTKHARVSALHDLTRKIPSAVLSDMIGYNPFVVATRAEKLGAPWQHYAALLSGASSRTATSQ